MHNIFRFTLFYRIMYDPFCFIKIKITTFDRFHACIKMRRCKRRVCKRKTLFGQPNTSHVCCTKRLEILSSRSFLFGNINWSNANNWKLEIFKQIREKLITRYFQSVYTTNTLLFLFEQVWLLWKIYTFHTRILRTVALYKSTISMDQRPLIPQFHPQPRSSQTSKIQ